MYRLRFWDFLSHFGLLIDVKNKQILDPLTSIAAPCALAKTAVYTVSTVPKADVPPGPLGNKFANLLNEFADIAAPSRAAALPEGCPVLHGIHTTGLPVFERLHRLVSDRLQAAKDEFNALHERGIVRPSSSQWASPLPLVKKRSGGGRVTGDYRRLYSCATLNRYPLPVIDDLL